MRDVSKDAKKTCFYLSEMHLQAGIGPRFRKVSKSLKPIG